MILLGENSSWSLKIIPEINLVPRLSLSLSPSRGREGNEVVQQ